MKEAELSEDQIGLDVFTIKKLEKMKRPRPLIAFTELAEFKVSDVTPAASDPIRPSGTSLDAKNIDA